jgi:hypothetical protein
MRSTICRQGSPKVHVRAVQSSAMMLVPAFASASADAKSGGMRSMPSWWRF